MEKPAATDHPIHELLRQRWSPRAFARRAVEPERLRSLLEAARWAPSCYNEQPWRFLLATSDEPQELERMLGCLVPGNQTWARSAPVLLITVASQSFRRNGRPNRHAFHDVGLAVAQLTLEAMAAGIYVHQMAGIDSERIREEYSLPEGFEPVTGVALGYPGDPAELAEKLREAETAERTRRPLAEMVFAGRWGVSSALVEPGRGRE